MRNAMEPWDALEAMFGATDVGNELPAVQQTLEIKCIAKELELLRCGLLNKFIAGCIIANQAGHSVLG